MKVKKGNVTAIAEHSLRLFLTVLGLTEDYCTQFNSIRTCVRKIWDVCNFRLQVNKACKLLCL